MVTFDDVRALALALPEVEEATSYGTPAFKVRGKLIVRLREEGDVLVVKAEIGHRDALIAAQPDVYFVTPHYHDSRYVLVRLPAVDAPDLADLLADAWRLVRRGDSPRTLTRIPAPSEHLVLRSTIPASLEQAGR